MWYELLITLHFQTYLIQHLFPGIKASLLISDSPANALYIDFHKTMIASLTLLDKSSNYSIPKSQNTPVPYVVMILTSPTKVTDVLLNETWREFGQFFVIIDGASDGCSNAQSFLKEAWKNDVINSIFLCWDQVYKLFSYNPFSEFAPASWQKVDEVQKADNRWTMFSQNFSESK